MTVTTTSLYKKIVISEEEYQLLSNNDKLDYLQIFNNPTLGINNYYFTRVFGTQYSLFQIGVNGPVIYTGNFDPSGANLPSDLGLVKDGDLFIRYDSTPNLYYYNNGTWVQITQNNMITTDQLPSTVVLKNSVGLIENPTFTFSTLPSASVSQSCIVFVSDRGNVPVYSDGNVWRYVNNNGVVS
jgi:hypothetical protein